MALGTAFSTPLGRTSCSFWGTMLSPVAWDREVESDMVVDLFGMDVGVERLDVCLRMGSVKCIDKKE